MAKQFQFDSDARQQLMSGIDTLVAAVGATLGPAGRNVVLDKEFGPPYVCSDGVTIAKEIELVEPFPNMGVQLVKEASSKTNDDVGDGTTSSTVVAQAMIRNGFRVLTAGANPLWRSSVASRWQSTAPGTRSVRWHSPSTAKSRSSRSQCFPLTIPRWVN